MSDAAQKLANGIKEAWNEKNWDKLKALHAEDWIDHTQPEGMNNLAALQGLFSVFAAGFPDFTIDIPKIIANGNNVSYLYEIKGTHTGEFMQIPATGKQVNFKGMTMLTMEDGKCMEAWGVMDQMTLMQQLGVIPTPDG